MPATTWALVTTRCGDITQPLPSCSRRHTGASPTTLTIESRAATTPAVWATRGSGGAAGAIGSAPIPSKTRGNSLASTCDRKSANARPTWAGITASTAPRTRDPATVRATLPGAAVRRVSPTNQ